MNSIKVTIQRRNITICSDFNLYTNNSVCGGLLDGCAGVMVTRGKQTSLEIIKTTRRRVPVLLSLINKKEEAAR